ncbi:unnamed protein product [Brachionus calyciflorus]|uniref:Uncharacterized protein n=1 Tax=Brachionus calyciflorus TaxID=104777 RepID=A0A813XCP2_9BILA|nr:unnamed protein product [Brachionus calyciflorus]
MSIVRQISPSGQDRENAQSNQMKKFDKKSSIFMSFNVGDFLMLKNLRQRVGHVKSFELKFSVLFAIKKVINDFNFEILNPQDNKTKVFNYDSLIKNNISKPDKETLNFSHNVLEDTWTEIERG